ncbi:Hypothetical protein YbbJ [Bacillus subtilis subsp. subtilis str. BSP1]|nr:Hypothetical protein YbbJ [Bacillus subtilis subsp. subtilis str. BSP1]
MTQDISLSFYKPEHLPELQSFTLTNDDKRFTSLPKEMLSQALGIQDRYPVVILKDDLPVGFFILHASKETLASYSNNPFALLLSSLSLNAVHHGKGYAKKAMLLLPAFERIFSMVRRNHLGRQSSEHTRKTPLYEKRVP